MTEPATRRDCPARPRCARRAMGRAVSCASPSGCARPRPISRSSWPISSISRRASRRPSAGSRTGARVDPRRAALLRSRRTSARGRAATRRGDRGGAARTSRSTSRCRPATTTRCSDALAAFCLRARGANGESAGLARRPSAASRSAERERARRASPCRDRRASASRRRDGRSLPAACAVRRRRARSESRGRIEPRIRVDRHAVRLHFLAHDRRRMAGDGRDELLLPRDGHERNGQQDPADRCSVMPGHLAADSRIWRVSVASASAGFSSGMMRRSMRNVTLSGTTLVLMPPEISPTVSVGVPMPSTFDRVAA